MNASVVFLLMNGCFASPIEDIAFKLSAISAKVERSSVLSFVDNNSRLKDKEDFKNNICNALDENAAVYSALAFDLQTDTIHRGSKAGCVLFENHEDAYVAQFLIACAIIYNYMNVQNEEILNNALANLKLSLIDGKTRIEGFLGSSKGIVTLIMEELK
jgi:hypothetical protein